MINSGKSQILMIIRSHRLGQIMLSCGQIKHCFVTERTKSFTFLSLQLLLIRKHFEGVQVLSHQSWQRERRCPCSQGVWWGTEPSAQSLSPSRAGPGTGSAHQGQLWRGTLLHPWESVWFYQRQFFEETIAREYIPDKQVPDTTGDVKRCSFAEQSHHLQHLMKISKETKTGLPLKGRL